MAAGMVVAMVAGGSAAWFTMRPTPLTLSQHSEKPGIPVEDSELRQWFQATRIGTAEAWQSVIDYPDVTEVVKLRAEQQLAWVYLNELEFDRALQVFDELASSSESNAEFKAFGLAGKCGVLSLQEKYAESADVLNQFLPYRTFLHDGQMTKMLRKTIDKNRTMLGRATPHEFDDWLERQFGVNAQETPPSPPNQLDK